MKRLFHSLGRPLLLAMLLAGASLAATAQAFPFKTLHVIVPFPPGGPTDVLGRMVAQGLPRFEAVSWYALMVPSGTPRDVIDRLSVETQRLFARPELKDKLAALGMDAWAGKPQELAAAIQAETVRWADVIRQKNIKPE